MKSRSIHPSAARTLKTPFKNARSPPVSTANQASANLVPKNADSATEGTQYFKRPGSKSGFTTTTFVPAFRA